MKPSKLNFIKAATILLTIIAISSCRKETTETATEDDAADAIETALATSSGGATQDISAAAQFAMSTGYNQLQCGVAFDTTVTYSHTGTVTANYTHAWNVLLNCNGSTPSSLNWTGSYQGSFDALRLSGNSSGTRNYTFTGLDASSPEYTLSASSTRTGTHTSKVRNQYTYTVNINTTLTNLSVNKSTYKITGGSGTVTATLSASNGTSKTFNGNIIFNGNSTATLTINGNTYTITVY